MTTVRIPPTLRTETEGERELTATGATLREVLDDVSTRFPALGDRILADGELAPFVNVYVEGEDVRTLAGLETPVREGATVILLPAMAGGRPHDPGPPTEPMLTSEAGLRGRLTPLAVERGRSSAPPRVILGRVACCATGAGPY
jgi:sulfur-carrier protein